MLSTSDNSTSTTYLYDDKGNRVYKSGNEGTVVYVNPNFTVRVHNGTVASKHIFAGNTRVCSKVTLDRADEAVYYYHGDHLGSSSVITDKAGTFYESLEYFPYGETWVQERVSADQTSLPYKFTGKELDPETGVYYYGARYYDARISRWISADPALLAGKYFPKPSDFDTEHDYFWYLENDKTHKLPGIGGVFNAINLDVYHYAGQNPVKLVDPDGNQSIESIFWRMGITTDTERKINEELIGSVESCYDSGYVSGIIFGFVGVEFPTISTNKYLPEGHKNSYLKGVADGSKFGKVLAYANIANGLRKLGIEGGKKGLKTFLGSDEKNIADFAKGLSKAFLPNVKEIEFESKAEAAGFLVGTAIKDLMNLPSQSDNKK